MKLLTWRHAIILLLFFTAGCDATETRINWLENGQKIDEDKKVPAPAKPSS